MDYLLLSSLSFVIGITVGLTGIGGAALITPMLIMVFHVPASVAIGSDVMAATLMKVVGGVKHWQQQTLDRQIVKWLSLGSVPGALLGIGLLHWLRQNQTLDLDTLLLQAVGGAILLVVLLALGQLACTVMSRLSLSQRSSDSTLNGWSDRWSTVNLQLDLETCKGRALTVAMGAMVGCIVGLTSIASGSLFALILLACFRLDSRKLVGTDLAQGAVLLGVTSLGHLSLGTISWSLVIPIWLGSIPGVLVGSQLCQFVPQRILKCILYLVLVTVSWKLSHSV